jgi:hypothetical protein
MTGLGILWMLCGCLIGIAAAKDKGYSTVGGFIGGALLGPLAFLMFLCSSGKKRCPFCAEWIQEKAKLCPHCGRGQ